MKSSSWHSRVPTRQRILGGLRGGLPSPPAPGHRCGLVAMSRICGACNKPCGTAHDCISCGKPVHSTVLCESVWMPGEESEEEGEGSDKPDPVAWSMPDGFTLGAEPSKLDASLVGKHIYMRWKDYGWQLGKVYEQITSANPRLLKKYNYRVVWADTAKGPTSLRVENYAHGSDAALDSWVVLERKEGGAGGAE